MDSEQAARYCARGHRNAPEARFCIACGDPLYTAAPPPPEPRPLYPDQSRVQPAPPVATQPATPPVWQEPAPTQTAPVPEPAAPRRRGLAWVLIPVALLAAAGVAAFVFLGVGSGPELRGLYVLFDEDGGIEGTWDDCEGTGGYSDFSAGMNVSIRGRSDEIVGSGDVINVSEELLPEIVEMDWASERLVGLDETEDADAAVTELRDMLRDSEGFGCWLFVRAELEDSDFYSIEVGDRGNLDYSREDLANDGYIISISLGL